MNMYFKRFIWLENVDTLFCVFHCVLQRLYKSGKNDDMHKYTLHSDDPDFVRAKINAQQISDVRRI